MTNTFQTVDPEDLSDLLLQAGYSFGFKFQDADFQGISTFGDLMSMIRGKIGSSEGGGCTYQQAFYRIRTAFIATGVAGEIRPGTTIDSLIPRKGRRKFIRQFDQELGFESGLEALNVYYILAILCSIVSPFLVFVSFNYFFIGIGAAMVLFFVSRFRPPGLSAVTIAEFSRKITWEQYSLVRRHRDTVNFNEIPDLFRDWFADHFGMEKAEIKLETSLGWN